jgi:hypothetical protein
MSSIANLGAASAALPQLNFHPHGHKKGAPELSTDLLSSQNTAQVPVPAVQNQFGNLLRSLEQAIGLGSSPAASAAPATKATAGAAPATGITAAASTAAAAAPTSAPTLNTLLQNYLRNAPQSVQADAAKLQSLAGSKVSFNA